MIALLEAGKFLLDVSQIRLNGLGLLLVLGQLRDQRGDLPVKPGQAIAGACEQVRLIGDAALRRGDPLLLAGHLRLNGKQPPFGL